MPRLAHQTTAYLKIADGCDRHCAYCTIPAIRGRFVSEPLDALVDEARTLIAAGAREIVLVGQDVTRWRGGRGGSADLAALVRTLADLDGDFRLRLMYVQPDGVTDALLEQMASSRRVCRYLDVPFQHASARVLARMGRGGDGEKALGLIARIRSVMPDVVLRTTVMAGFPGETAADFAELESFIEEAAFDYVGVFAYSPEEGTPAAALDGQVRRAVRIRRAQRLRDLADRIGFARAAARVGSVAQVLVEGVDEAGETVGRTCGQAPEVDGVTVLDGRARPGDFARVRITDAVGYDLVGVVL
jgi:ribosomal protein S12 methylthiotransferase